MSGTCSTRGDKKCIQNFNRKPKGKRLVGRPKRRWEGKIKVDIKEIMFEDVDCVRLTQDGV
jgi:hypothetical protein